MTTHPSREPILRVVPSPGDINANGHIFGGWVVSQMDIGGGIAASHRAQGPVATVAIERMEFIAPIHLRDLISVFAQATNGLGAILAGAAAHYVGAPNALLLGSLLCFIMISAICIAIPQLWRYRS